LNPRNLKTVPGVFTTKTGAEHLSSYAAENTMQSGLEYYTLDQDDEYSTKSYGTSSSGHATYYYGTVPETKTCCCQTPTTNQGQSRREDYIDLTNWGHQSR